MAEVPGVLRDARARVAVAGAGAAAVVALDRPIDRKFMPFAWARLSIVCASFGDVTSVFFG
ncbi:MAG: hypothetical protein ABJB47_01645 [Actinomycetota bacterium]